MGALLASAGLIASFAALGLNSIAVARIEGPDGAGLVALSTQVVVIAAAVRLTSGNSRRTISAVPSPEALSTTCTSSRRSPDGREAS